MFEKETCPVCKGKRYVTVRVRKGAADFRKCPGCAGVGFKVKTRTVC